MGLGMFGRVIWIGFSCDVDNMQVRTGKVP